MKRKLTIPKSYRPFALSCVLLLLSLALGFAYLALARAYPEVFACAFARRAHLYCPGCGGSRAIYALLRLDLVASLVANPAVLFGGVTVLYYEVALFRFARGARVRAFPLIAYAALIVLWFLLRNVLLVFAGIDPLGDLISYWR